MIVFEEVLSWGCRRQEDRVRLTPMSDGQVAYMKAEREKSANNLKQIQLQAVIDQKAFLARFDKVR